MHVIAKKAHFNKKATTALLAKAVEVCEKRGATHLTYGAYVYNDPKSSLTEFKRRHGFQQVLLPRYYIPLTWRGWIFLKLGLHHGVAGLLPASIKRLLLQARSALNTRFRKPAEGLKHAGTGATVDAHDNT